MKKILLLNHSRLIRNQFEHMYLLYDEDDHTNPYHFYMIMMRIKLIYHHRHKYEDFFLQRRKLVNEIYDFDMLKEAWDYLCIVE
jgi:hypothetical protein